MNVGREMAALLLVGLAAGAGASTLVRATRRRAAISIPLLAALFFLGDGLLLWSLPHLGLSFSPDVGPSLVSSFLLRLALLGTLVVAARLARRSGPSRGAVLIFVTLNLGMSGVQVYAYGVEPLWIETTHLSLASSALDPDAPPVRVVHLTDLHVERSSHREAAVVRRVNELRPDVVVLTGDYLNVSNLFDPTSIEHLQRLVDQLEAPYGIYAVRGSVEARPEWMDHLWAGTGVVWLEQEARTIEVRGQPLTLVGVACSHQHNKDVARLAQALAGAPDDTPRLLLYHSPDLIHEAAEAGIDLYLAGHTHGGQICLPFYGPVVTFSRYGRQYAAGRFEVEGTTLYVSRGLGFEGGGAPRARFLARPEIVVVDLLAAGGD